MNFKVLSMGNNASNNNRSGQLEGHLDTKNLLLVWAEAPWDSAVLGYPVLQINRIELRGPSADQEMDAFELARDQVDSGLVSCRLPHDYLRESMLLESRGFRFIEMMYQPELAGLEVYVDRSSTGLQILPGSKSDLPALLVIARTAFRNERFHMDPRLDSRLGNERYCNWVKSSIDHLRQRLYVVRDGDLIVAFFVTEQLEDGTCYWHLNAVAPELQGHGYGRRAWTSMLQHALGEGAQKVRTSISARNFRVMNLYARLGFRFASPQITLHWLRSS